MTPMITGLGTAATNWCWCCCNRRRDRRWSP